MPALPVIVVRHVPHESAGLIGEALRAAGLQLDVRDLFSGELGHFNPSAAAGLVVMGGPMSANDAATDRLLARELEWLSAAVAAETPVLGVCLGAQLLAKSCGARVFRNAVREIGWGDIEFTAAAQHDGLLAPCPPQARVLHWHGETFDLPRGAVHLARSAVCEHQAFRVGPRAWGLQYHCELTPELFGQWLDDPDMQCEASAPPAVDLASLRAEGERAFPAYLELGRQVLGRFAAACAA